jgi:protein O-mannosyl-transferase
VVSDGALSLRARRFDVVVAAILAAVAFVAFSPGLFGPFLWDDVSLIPSNPSVRSLAHVRVWFTHDFWDVSPDLLQFANRVRYYRPLVTASYALDWRLGGGDPFVFHLTNSFGHIAVVVLAFFALRRWTTSVASAAFGAAFFAIHPTKAESVAWIAGRTDILCTLAMLLATLGAARRMRGHRGGVALEATATVVAYLTKEGAILLPALIAVEQWAALDRPALDRVAIKKVVVAALPQLAIAIAYLVLRAVVMPLRPASPGVGVVDHAQFFFESIGRYVLLSLGAHELSSQHALLRTFNGRFVHHAGYVVFGAIALVALFVGAFAARRRAPAITVGIALFFALLVPVSNLVLTGLGTLVAERFLYAPLLGVALVVATLVERFANRRALVWSAFAALALVAFVRTLDRAIDFSDDGRFWARERTLHPESLEAHRFAIARAKTEHKYPTALKYAADAREQAARFYAHFGAEAEFVHEYIEVSALLTPDRSVDRLKSIDAFFAALLDPLVVTASVELEGTHIELVLHGALHERVRAMRVRTMIARASTLSRLGADSAASALIDDAYAACPGCINAGIVGALAAARSGDYARARALCDRVASARGESLVAEQRKAIESAYVARRQASAASGPVMLNLQAQELARLEAWGRAYEVLSPYRVQIEQAPGFAFGFAELAFRAGEATVAREVLEKQIPADKVPATLALWGRKMGWIE